MHTDYIMDKSGILMAPKVNAKTSRGVIGMPFTGGAYIIDMFKTHGFTTGGPIRLYRIWLCMKQRTTNPLNTHYKYYGGRGIRRCNEWNNFVTFYQWSLGNGYADNLTIDRINNDGNYCPENCRWVTKSENNKNKPSKRIGDWGIYRKKNGFYVQITIDGIFYCGGYSPDIIKARQFRDKLLLDIKEGRKDPADIIPRKHLLRDKMTGRFIWD